MPLSRFAIRSGRLPAPINLTGRGGVVSNAGPSTVYYGTSGGLTSGTADGSIAASASATLTDTQYFVLASGGTAANLTVNIPEGVPARLSSDPDDAGKVIDAFTGLPVAQSGGSSAAVVAVEKAFAFDDPGLLTGITVYTATGGETLTRDSAVRIITAFDGTTPAWHLKIEGAATYLVEGGADTADSVVADGTVTPAANYNHNGQYLPAGAVVELYVDDGAAGPVGGAAGEGLVKLLISPPDA